MTREQRLGWLFDGLLALACVLAFWPGMSAALNHYDDSLYIYWNTEVLGRKGLAGFLGVWDGTRAWSGEFVEYFPLRDSVYWVIYQLWGLEGLPYHLASLFFHVTASLLSLRLARALGLSPWASRAAALLFAVHPIHIESVVWAAGLKDPMYTTFMFGALLVYARYRQAMRPWQYGATIGLLSLALLVKSMAISAPLILIFMERWVGQPTPWRLLFKRVAGIGLVTAVFFAQILAVGRANHAVTPPHGGSWVNHAVLTAWAQVKYAKQAFVPSTFRLVYCFEPPTGLRDPRLWAAVALAAGLVALAAFWWRRDKRLWLFCLAWYVACLLPVSNIIPFPAVMADRYLYAAVFGVCLLVPLWFELLDERLRTPLIAAIALAFVVTSASRSALWQDEELLWAEADEDPACLVDTAFPAADAHLVRYWLAKDRRVGLMALERALVTPGLMAQGIEHFCDVLVSGAHEAASLGYPDRGAPWAKLAAQRCPFRVDTWSAVMITNLHKRPVLAAAGAERAWNLSRSPRAGVMRGLTRLELGQDWAVNLVVDAVKAGPEESCPALDGWTSDVPHLAPRVAEAAALCVSYQQAVRTGAPWPPPPGPEAPPDGGAPP